MNNVLHNQYINTGFETLTRLEDEMTTWGPRAASMTEEERARYLQGVIWECEQGHSARIRCVDGFRWRRFDTRTMRWELHIRGLRWLPALIGDQFRAVAADLRRFRTRYILRRKNPYWD